MDKIDFDIMLLVFIAFVVLPLAMGRHREIIVSMLLFVLPSNWEKLILKIFGGREQSIKGYKDTHGERKEELIFYFKKTHEELRKHLKDDQMVVLIGRHDRP